MQIYEQHALHVYKNYYTKFFKTPCMLTLHSEHLLFPHWFRKKSNTTTGLHSRS